MTMTGVWVMRHGARADESREIRLKIMRGEKCIVDGWDSHGPRWWDPPLTKAGKKVARLEAARLKELNFEKVYTSPLLRALQTTEQVASILNIPVEIIPGLSQCAAIVQKVGISNFLKPNKRNQQEALYGAEEAKLLCPDMEVLGTNGVSETFEAACCRLAKENKGKDILVVAHREGIWKLHARAGHRLMKKPPYCSITGYLFEFKNGKMNASKERTNPKQSGNPEAFPGLTIKLVADTSTAKSQ
eukprot:jgi/Bigna1/70388/fgenesh1_pg.11_\